MAPFIVSMNHSYVRALAGYYNKCSAVYLDPTAQIELYMSHESRLLTVTSSRVFTTMVAYLTYSLCDCLNWRQI